MTSIIADDQTVRRQKDYPGAFSKRVATNKEQRDRYTGDTLITQHRERESACVRMHASNPDLIDTRICRNLKMPPLSRAGSRDGGACHSRHPVPDARNAIKLLLNTIGIMMRRKIVKIN